MRRFLTIVGSLAAILVCAPGQPALKDALQGKFLIGAALNADQIDGKDVSGIALVEKNFNTITPENVLKWERVHAAPGKYNFDAADRFVAFGQKNGMFIVGHTLVWHSQTPRWVFEGPDGKPADRATLLERMREHIQSVVGRYKGRVKGWDVVNEALDEDGALRASPWLKIIGEDYVLKAFTYAHEADPEAELYYNDFSLENAPKRHGAVALVMKLRENGIRVAGVGTQGHYKMDWPLPDQIDSTISAFAALGVPTMFTELDVDLLPNPEHYHGAEVGYRAEARPEANPYANGLPDSVERALTDRYATLFAAFLRGGKNVLRVTFWGVSDRDSWLNNWPMPGRTSYPLLFDRHGRAKPAYFAVVKAAAGS